MLVQQYRYDMSWQQDPSGGTVTSNYGASRGLKVIPATRFEVGISPPAYFVHQSKTLDGFGDLSWQVKFRAFSATEGQRDYFVGFFLGGSFPTGTPPNGLGHTVLIPTFATAKSLGPWDIQTTIGANLPATGANREQCTDLRRSRLRDGCRGIASSKHSAEGLEGRLVSVVFATLCVTRTRASLPGGGSWVRCPPAGHLPEKRPRRIWTSWAGPVPRDSRQSRAQARTVAPSLERQLSVQEVKT